MRNMKKIFNRANLARLLLLFFDVFSVNFSYYVTLIIRFYVAHSLPENCLKYFEAFWKFMPYYTVFCIVTFLLCRLYNSVWRYVGVNDLHRILSANIITTVANIVGSCTFVLRMPISYYVIGALIQFGLLCVSRFGYRVYLLEVARISKIRGNIFINVMIVGIGETAQIVRRRIDNDKSNIARPVCAFTTEIDRKYTVFNGIPLVTGLNNFGKYIDYYKVDCVALADTKISSEELKYIKGVCKEKNVEIQNFSEYFSLDEDTRVLMGILNNIESSVEIVVDGNSEIFSSGIEALYKLTGGYVISRISMNSERLILELSSSKKIISSPKEDWARTIDKNGEISFF